MLRPVSRSDGFMTARLGTHLTTRLFVSACAASVDDNKGTTNPQADDGAGFFDSGAPTGDGAGGGPIKKVVVVRQLGWLDAAVPAC